MRKQSQILIQREAHVEMIVNICFQPLSKVHTNGEISCSIMQLQKILMEPSPVQRSSLSLPSANSTKVTLNQSSYQIYVTAHNSVGPSPASAVAISGHPENGEFLWFCFSSLGKCYLGVICRYDKLERVVWRDKDAAAKLSVILGPGMLAGFWDSPPWCGKISAMAQDISSRDTLPLIWEVISNFI